jgi:hypothetical protein
MIKSDGQSYDGDPVEALLGENGSGDIESISEDLS